MEGQASKSLPGFKQMLQTLGYDLGEGGVDGRFGPDTKAALKQLQREYGLKSDGIYGTRTRRLLNRLQSRSAAEGQANLREARDDQEASVEEATLTAKARKALPKGAYAIPEKEAYPI